MTRSVSIAVFCCALNGCGQQIPTGRHVDQGGQDRPGASPSSEGITLSVSEPLAGEMLSDSIGMSLHSIGDTTIVSLERLVQHDANGRAIMVITDTLRFSPPAGARSLRRCTQEGRVIWLAVGQNGEVISRYGAWTAQKDGLHRLGEHAPHDCPQDDGPTSDDH